MEFQEGWRIHEWGGDLVWGSFARPEPGAGEVLVKVEACGIGLTVLRYMSGNLSTDPADLPRVPGHEIAGIVTHVGAGADARLVGRRVVAYFYLSCGMCEQCVTGDEPRCSKLAGWVGVHRDGGYAPWTVLPARNVIIVPDELDAVSATVVPDAVATPVHVCRQRARVTQTDRVAVIGAGGGVGIHLVQVAQLLGAQVAGLDLTDEKLALVERFGAVPYQSGSLESLDGCFWPRGAPTVVVDFVCTPETLAWGAEVLTPGGRLVAVTTTPGAQLTVLPRDLVFREIAVLGSRYAGREEVAIAAELVATGRVQPVVGETVGPEGVAAVHKQLRAGTLLGRGALVWPAPDETGG